MKKILTIVGVALLTGGANAAVVSWNSGTFTEGFKDKNGNSLAQSTAYKMLVSFYSDSKGETLVTTSEATTAKPNGAYSNKTGDVFSSDTTYYVSAVISATDGSSSLKSGLASFTSPLTGDVTINFATGSGFDTVAKKWSADGWQSIPEPTSAMLVMLGLCGLALKRKQK